MKYTPSSVVDTELDVARAAYFGGEFAVYLTQVPAIQIAEIDLSAASVGTIIANLGSSIKTVGADLQMVPITPINSPGGALAITVNGTDSASSPQSGLATFSPPARATNQTFNFARGFAVDIVAADVFKTLNTTSSSANPGIVNGGPLQKLRIYQLPEVTDYELILASMEIDFNTKDRVAKGIDAGMESDFWVKRGKAQPGELTIGSKYRGVMDGISRYSGQKCTVMLVGLKEGEVTTDRLVFTQWVGTVKPKLPDGDGEATIEATGKFVDHLFFVAP